MGMLFAKSTNGFYDEQLSPNFPDDAVAVSDSDYAYLMQGQADGKKIVGDQSGNPVLVDRVPTQQELIDNCKTVAKNKLVSTDWSQTADVAEILLNKADFDTYRAVVRNLFLLPVPNPTWPVEPVAVWKE